MHMGRSVSAEAIPADSASVQPLCTIMAVRTELYPTSFITAVTEQDHVLARATVQVSWYIITC